MPSGKDWANTMSTEFFYLITVNAGIQGRGGHHTIADVITAMPGDSRLTLFAKIMRKAAEGAGTDSASVEFFYLEPVKLP